MIKGDGWDRAIEDGSIGGRSNRETTSPYATAADAKRMSDKARAIHGEYKKQETEAIIAKIKEAANKGLTDIWLNGTGIDAVVEQRLTSLGYVVKKDFGDQRDLRDCGSTSVSWG